MFRVVADHASAEQKAMSPRAGKQAATAAGAETFCRQPQGVSNCRTQQDSDEAVLHRPVLLSCIPTIWLPRQT